jgi:hypothetical protein
MFDSEHDQAQRLLGQRLKNTTRMNMLPRRLHIPPHRHARSKAESQDDGKSKRESNVPASGILPLAGDKESDKGLIVSPSFGR